MAAGLRLELDVRLLTEHQILRVGDDEPYHCPEYDEKPTIKRARTKKPSGECAARTALDLVERIEAMSAGGLSDIEPAVPSVKQRAEVVVHPVYFWPSSARAQQ